MKYMYSKIIMCFVCILIVMNAGKTFSYTEFIDISEKYWAKESIEKFTKNGVVSGYPDSTFRPGDPVKINEFLKMIIIAGNYEIIPSGIKVWPDFYIVTAKKNNLIYDDEYITYEEPLKRKDVITILSRFIDLTNVKESKRVFKDEKENSNLQKLITLKIINGYEDKTFKGDNVITRAEAIAILDRAVKNRKKINMNKKIKITERKDLSNYGSGENDSKVYPKTRYEILEDALIIYDSGKYSSEWGYEVSNKKIDIKKVNEIIKKIVSEESYVGVFYSSSEQLINQLILMYGENENKINLGGPSFILTYYENQPYEAKRILLEEKFSNDCYMKIELRKMWRDYYDFSQGNVIDEYNKKDLEEALEIQFRK